MRDVYVICTDHMKLILQTNNTNKQTNKQTRIAVAIVLTVIADADMSV